MRSALVAAVGYSKLFGAAVAVFSQWHDRSLDQFRAEGKASLPYMASVLGEARHPSSLSTPQP